MWPERRCATLEKNYLSFLICTQKSREQVWEWILRHGVMVEGRWLEIWWQWNGGKRSVDRLLWAKHLKLFVSCVIAHWSVTSAEDLIIKWIGWSVLWVTVSFPSHAPPIIIQWAYEHSGGRGWTLCMGSATWTSIHQGHLTVATAGCSSGCREKHWIPNIAAFPIVVVTKLCPTLCDPMKCSTLGFPVLHCLLGFAQTHVHCPLSWWCHPTISSSVTPFSPCPQSLPASGGQSIRASASVIPMNIETGLISLLSEQLSRVFSHTTIQKHQFFLTLSCLYGPSHHISYMTTIKTIPWTIWNFAGKVISLLFNTLSRLFIAFLPRSERLLISWLQSPSAVILELKEIKSVTLSTFPPSICHEVMGLDAMIFFFWMLSFNPTFHSPLSPSSRSSLVLLHFLP